MAAGLVDLDFARALGYISSFTDRGIRITIDPIQIPAGFLRHSLGRFTSANPLLNYTWTQGIQCVLLALEMIYASDSNPQRNIVIRLTYSPLLLSINAPGAGPGIGSWFNEIGTACVGT